MPAPIPIKTVAIYRGKMKHVDKALEDERRLPLTFPDDEKYFDMNTGLPMRPVRGEHRNFYRYLPGNVPTSSGQGGGGESLAHRKMKEIIAEADGISFVSYGKSYSFQFRSGPQEMEVPFRRQNGGPDLRLDLVARLNAPGAPIDGAENLVIELKVENPLKKAKKAELRIARRPSIEIELPEGLAKYSDADIGASDFIELEARLRGLHRNGFKVVKWIYPNTYVAPPSPLLTLPAQEPQAPVCVPEPAVVFPKPVNARQIPAASIVPVPNSDAPRQSEPTSAPGFFRRLLAFFGFE